MKKSDIPSLPEFFDRYINLVEDIDLVEALKKHTFASVFDLQKMKQLGDLVYEANKWTMKDIVQHALDTERIMAYRALTFARNDKTPLPGFEENDYGRTAEASKRSLDDLLEESSIVRASSIALFKNFTPEMMLRTGVSSKREISVLALGFVIVGHPIHHAKVVRERYFPLLNN